jgi:hypothetical protein
VADWFGNLWARVPIVDETIAALTDGHGDIMVAASAIAPIQVRQPPGLATTLAENRVGITTTSATPAKWCGPDP